MSTSPDALYGTDDPSALYDNLIVDPSLYDSPTLQQQTNPQGVINFPSTTINTPGLSTAQTASASGLGPQSVIDSIASFALTGAVLAKLPASQIASVSPTGGVTTINNGALQASYALAQAQQAGAQNQKYLMYGIIVLAIIVIGYFTFKRR